MTTIIDLNINHDNTFKVLNQSFFQIIAFPFSILLDLRSQNNPKMCTYSKVFLDKVNFFISRFKKTGKLNITPINLILCSIAAQFKVQPWPSQLARNSPKVFTREKGRSFIYIGQNKCGYFRVFLSFALHIIFLSTQTTMGSKSLLNRNSYLENFTKHFLIFHSDVER